ncbi:MAG: FAD-binding oxidoreductase [Micrococcales bacterium]|nr:FAD-binding oxidoreductase [Micrococcales bacterium]
MDGPRALSLWWDQVVTDDPAAAEPGEPLDGDTAADVTIVGGGLTGLWTAYYLHEADPSLDVLVIEAERVGFGASGRNGGWCSALFPAAGSRLARRYGAEAARSMRAAMRDTVVEVGRAASAEGIDCDFHAGGSLTLARSRPQLERIEAAVAEDHRWGDQTVLLSAAEASARADATGVRGGSWTPDSARVQPLRLVRGLAEVVRARGVRVAERTRVTQIAPGAVLTDHGRVRTRWSVRATEAWTPRIPGAHREIAPVYSLMVATEPLDDATWGRIGLAGSETFADARNVIVYGQRTADGRIAFGGRGAPYHRGSRVSPAFDRDERVFANLRAVLVEMFPTLAGVEITHAWGGPVGVPRDWCASVGLDARTGQGWAGGYVGDGVSTANLAGRTLADLVTGARTPLVSLPWVGHRSPRWEPEPLRWAGITAGLKVAERADAAERTTGRRSRLEPVLARLTSR